MIRASLFFLPLLLVTATAAGGAGPAGAARDQAEGARVSAHVSYGRAGTRYRNVRLTIRRNGRAVYTARIARRPPPLWRPVLPVRLPDLNGDGSPEVILDVFTGGPHCCTRSHVFRRLRNGGYGRSVRHWGNPGYSLSNVDGGRRLEFVTGDDRFTSRWVPYVLSAQPVQIFRFSGGRFANVTRRHQRLIRRDAAQLWQRYRALKRRRADVRGVLAAWMADRARVGQARSGWRTLDRARRRGELGRGTRSAGTPAGRAYIRSLRRFLRQRGYLG